MASNSFRVKKSLNVKPETSPTLDEMGDVGVTTSTGKASFHNGTTASPVVTEAHTATLTNKTLTSPTISGPTVTGTLSGVTASFTTNLTVAELSGFGSGGASASSTVFVSSFPAASIANGVLVNGSSNSSNTAYVAGFQTLINTAAASYTVPALYNFYAGNGTLGAGSAITNAYGFYSEDLTRAATNYGYYSAMSSGAQKYAFYGAGTAASQFGGTVNAAGKITATANTTGISVSPATATTAAIIDFNNTGGRSRVGVEGSSAGGILAGSSAYDMSIVSATGRSLGLGVDDGAVQGIRIATGTGAVTIPGTLTTGLLTAAVSGDNAQLKLQRTTSSAGSGYLGANSANALIVSDSSFNARMSISQAGAVDIPGTLSITGGIIGSNGTSAATAGNVGEIIRATVAAGGSAVSVTTATYTDVTSISLTAGDWDLSAVVSFNGTVTGTVFEAGIGPNSASVTGMAYGDNLMQFNGNIAPTAVADSSVSLPSWNVRVTSTSTYYLIVKGTYTVGTLKAYGRLSARRVR